MVDQDHLHLAEDLILEIFSHLPPTSLLRFKSVSKTWYSLISNPDFGRRHTALYRFNHHSCHHRHRHRHIDDDHHHLLAPGILLRRQFDAGYTNIVIHTQPPPCELDHHQQQTHALLLQRLIDYRPAPAPLNDDQDQLLLAPPPKKEDFILTDSCNGLLLYVHRCTRKIDKEKQIEYCRSRTIYVCNPITNDYIKLPTIDIVVDIDYVEQYQTGIAQLVFNPTSFSHTLTYKVFTWVHGVKRTSSTSRSDSSSSSYRRLYVYSSETRSWRPSVSIPITEFSEHLFCFDLKAVLWNGVLHWNTLFANNTGTSDVLSLCYDIEKETVWTMNFPKMATGYTHRRLLYFGECGGRLLLIEKHYRDYEVNWFPSTFDVMEKRQLHNGDESEEMWTVRYRVYLNDIRSDTSILDIYRMTRTMKGEEEEEEVMLMKVGSSNRNHRIISFNLTSDNFGNEELRNRKTVLPNTGCLYYTEILWYNATLFPP